METHQNNNQVQEPTYHAVDENFLRKEINKLLHSLGMPAHVLGYEYTREAIFIALGNKDILRSITKELYPSVAQAFNTTPSRVERAIRHAVELAWDRGIWIPFRNSLGLLLAPRKVIPPTASSSLPWLIIFAWSFSCAESLSVWVCCIWLSCFVWVNRRQESITESHYTGHDTDSHLACNSYPGYQ